MGFVLQRREISMTAKAEWGEDQTYPLDEVSDSSASSSSSSSSEEDGEGREEVGDLAVGPLVPRVKELPRCRLKVEGLLADHTYDFRVAALNDNGASAWSPASIRGRTKPPKKPDTIRKGLSADEVYPTAIAFTWAEPYFYGAPIEEYTVEQQRLSKPKSVEGEDEWAGAIEGMDDHGAAEAAAEKERLANMDLHVVRTSSVRNMRAEDLVTGSSYRFRVAARNVVGRGPWSPWTPEIRITDECCGDPFVEE